MEIIKYLRFVCIHKTRHAFQFDDYLVKANEVSVILFVEQMPFIKYSYMRFAPVGDSSFAKLNLQSILINCFKESVAKFVVYSHACTDDTICLFFIKNHTDSISLFVFNKQICSRLTAFANPEPVSRVSGEQIRLLSIPIHSLMAF